MSERCYDCGKRYTHINRTRHEQDDDIMSWSSVPVCRQCWDGVVLVPNEWAEEIVCDECDRKDCKRARAAVRQYEDDICEEIDERYPSAKVVFVDRSEMAEYEAANWEPAGYRLCPDSMGSDWCPDWEALPPCSNQEDE